MPVDNNDNSDDRGRHHGPWGDRGLRGVERLRRIQFGQRGFLRPQLIQLLEKRPMNGVDIMDELQEMSRHVDFLINRGLLNDDIESLELNDLPGVQGLKALRVEVNLKSKALAEAATEE